jgi:tetratricopeptide (TPR) repeat protein
MILYSSIVTLDAKLDLNPEDSSSLLTRARWFQHLDYPEACKLDREQALLLLNEQSGDPGALRYRGWLYFDAERWDDAVRDFTAALIHRPADLLMLRLRAAANMHLARWQSAYDDFTTISELFTNPVHQLGDWPDRCCALLEMGKESEALADASGLVEAAAKYPKYADSLVSTFMLQNKVDRFPDATLALARQGIERHPNDNVYLGELGGVQFYLGQYSDAVQNLEPNAADGPSASSASAGFWLAMSLHHLGEAEKAEAAFHRAVRNWKGMAAPQPKEERFFVSLWTQAAALLGIEAPHSK